MGRRNRRGRPRSTQPTGPARSSGWPSGEAGRRPHKPGRPGRSAVDEAPRPSGRGRCGSLRRDVSPRAIGMRMPRSPGHLDRSFVAASAWRITPCPVRGQEPARACAARSVPSATTTIPACWAVPDPRSATWWMLTQLAPGRLTRALRRGQCDRVGAGAHRLRLAVGRPTDPRLGGRRPMTIAPRRRRFEQAR